MQSKGGHLAAKVVQEMWLLMRSQTTAGVYLEPYEPVSQSYKPIAISMYKAPINAKICIINSVAS